MTNFAGFEMPISYGSIINEHNCVRNSVGVFDVSHMGEFLVEGKSAEKFLQYCCSNDIKKLFVGKAQYNYLPNLNGGIIDDLIVYKLEKYKYLLVLNASNIEKDWDHLNLLNKKFGADLKNISDNISLLSVQGPNSTKLLNKVSKFKFESLKNYMNCITSIAGINNVIVASTGYTGAGGYEIYCDNKNVEHIWKTIFDEGKEFDVSPIGLAARDSLRIEMGYCLYGNEIDDSTSPIEAGLGWITKTQTNFYGSNLIKEDIDNECKYMMVGVKSEDRIIPRKGNIILNCSKNEIGFITSGTFSPTLKKPIGIGFILREVINSDEEIFVDNKRKTFKAKVSSLPFIKFWVNKILILGGSGFIGYSLYKELSPYFKTFGTFCSNKKFKKNKHFFEYDIERSDIKKLLTKLKPNIIISSIRGPFKNQIISHITLIKYSKKFNFKLIFLSSSNVFDSFHNYPSYEYDKTLSESKYGIFKIKIENEILKMETKNFVIARLPMIFGVNCPRIKEMKNKMIEKKPFEVFPNSIINVNSILKLCQQIHYIINHGMNGIFHLGSSDLISHYEFFKKLAIHRNFKKLVFKQVFTMNDLRYIAVLPKENKLPSHLTITCDEVLSDSHTDKQKNGKSVWI